MAVQLGARLIAVAEAAKNAIAARWDPAEPDECTRDFAEELQTKEIEGRRVYVLPAGAATVQRLTRARVLNEYRVSVRVVERYTDAGRPLVEWLDERVTFLDTVLGALDVTAPADLLLGTLWTETIEVTEACSIDDMVVRKLYLAEIEVAFREEAAG